jgi:hypothetical protein
MSNLIPYKNLLAAAGGGSNESALDLIYNFLNEPGLKGMSELALGGTFPLKDFQLATGSFGKTFWFCYDRSQKKPAQRIFLALEDSHKGWSRKMTVKEIPGKPENKVLRRPALTFAFDDKNFNRTDKASVDLFIQSHVDANHSSKSIGAADVQKFGKALVSAFGGKAKGKGYCYYPLAHFENFEPESRETHIDNFLSQGEIHYVRYYFGLDVSKKHGPNRIRIVVFPVAAERKMLLTADGGGGQILEKSVPPPPVN